MTSTCFWGCVPMPRSQRGLRGIGAMVKLHRIHAVCSSIPHWDSNHLVRLYLWGVTSNGGVTPSCIIQQEVVMDDPSWTRWPAPGTPGTTFFQLQLWVPCRCSTRPWKRAAVWFRHSRCWKKPRKYADWKIVKQRKYMSWNELNMIQWVVNQVTVVGFTEKRNLDVNQKIYWELGDSSANVWI